MNVVILIFDTVGYNYTSLGGGPASMPNLQRWADNNLHLTSYISPATYTCQAVPSILSGLNVLHHCTAMPVIPTWNIPRSITTIFDVFLANGYSCCVLGDAYHLPLLSRAIPVEYRSHMIRGRYHLNPEFNICEMYPRSEITEDLGYVPELLINSGGELPEPYIIVMHIMAAHGPMGDYPRSKDIGIRYKEVPQGSDERVLVTQELIDFYVERLTDIDSQIIGPIIDAFEDDFLVIMSDHGISIDNIATGVGHMHWNIVDALFCMTYPKPVTYTYPMGGVDILPTICELFGIELDCSIDGISMVDNINNNIPNNRFYHSWANNCQMVQRGETRITITDPRLPHRWYKQDKTYDKTLVGHCGNIIKDISPTGPMIDWSNPANYYVNIHDYSVSEYIEWYNDQLNMPLPDGILHPFHDYDEVVPENRDARCGPDGV